MEAVAKGKYIKCSARKMRAVADVVRNNSVESSRAVLFGLEKTKKSARIIRKVLESAIANFKDRQPEKQVDEGSLKIKSIMVDGGPLIKRIRPRSQGRAFRIHKNQCHLTVSISD